MFVSLLPSIHNTCLTDVTGSRRLITYRRIPDNEVDPEAMKAREETTYVGKSADELNPFRKAYFNKFEN